MKQKKHKFFFVLLLIAVFGLTMKGQSQCTFYSGTACVPSDVSINDKSYKQTHGRVYHTTNSVRPITLFGPLINTIPENRRSDWWFKIHFIDSDITGNAATIAAVIKAVNKETGVVTQMGAMSSNNPNAPNTEWEGGTIQNMSVKFNQAFDFENFYYYVQVTIARTTTRVSAVFLGYSLCLNITD